MHPRCSRSRISRRSRSRPGVTRSSWSIARVRYVRHLGEGAPSPRVLHRAFISIGGVVEPIRLLVMAGDQTPVGVRTTGESVADLAVQRPTHARRRHLRGDLPQEFVPKPPDVGTPRLEHQRVFEFTDDMVDVLLPEIDHTAQQGADPRVGR